MPIAFIGLGSNLENPREQVLSAMSEMNLLAQTQVIQVSRLYQSKAVGPEQPDYINAVAALQTELIPIQLLDALQSIEQAHHRVRKEHWGPRTLDLDLLLYGDETIDLPRLKVPHPFLSQRNFVLIPLADIEPHLTLPSGDAIQKLIEQIGYAGLAAIETLDLPKVLARNTLEERL